MEGRWYVSRGRKDKSWYRKSRRFMGNKERREKCCLFLYMYFMTHKSGDGDGSRAMYTVRLFYFLTFEGMPQANWQESGKCK